jgi:O-antigen biosynthesis protein
LVELKRRHRKAVEIVTAGAEIHRAVLRTYPEIKTLGLLKVEQTGDLYRRCHAGLSLMLTKHPSYLPFEMMASGTVVVANRNAANTWLLKHNENCLVGEPTASYLCDQFSLLFEDRVLYQRLLAASLQTVGQYNWEQQLKKIHAFVSGVGQDSA